MARHYGVEKIELRALLEMISGSAHAAGDLVAQIVERSHCSERAAKDALAILKRAKLVDARVGESDRRRRMYVVTRRGRAVLARRYGPRCYCASRGSCSQAAPHPVGERDKRL